MQEYRNTRASEEWGHLSRALYNATEVGLEIKESEGALAAVLVLIYHKEGEPHIVLTRRTDRVAEHKGEISLPGGAYEADRDESLLHTALREAYEEIGIVTHELQILGRLPKVHTRSSNYDIIPYVATSSSSLSFIADPFEVAEVLEVPLSVLRDPEAIREEYQERDGQIDLERFYSHGEHKIWGATARILTSFLTALNSSEAY